jgi:hypothetical protein
MYLNNNIYDKNKIKSLIRILKKNSEINNKNIINNIESNLQLKKYNISKNESNIIRKLINNYGTSNILNLNKNLFMIKKKHIGGSNQTGNIKPKVTQNTSINTPVAANNTPVAANNTPVAANNTPVAANNTPVAANNTPVAANNTPVAANNTPVAANNTPVPIEFVQDDVLNIPTKINNQLESSYNTDNTFYQPQYNIKNNHSINRSTKNKISQKLVNISNGTKSNYNKICNNAVPPFYRPRVKIET